MILRKNMQVYVEGDAAAITTSDYTVRIASPATVVDEPGPDDEYVLLSIDYIAGDRNVWMYVLRKNVRELA